ncbi:TonB-dependent receptor [Occallatibacter riparius]|uniref:Carboxypeptidase-like regulatory domain-containing protein n=1 Tax=Occallatibacter riparius TaxID=1002689 RepID=A0A9J7BJV2_9BACT|nr:carboxypeptidase-like regulatory domain-containing protein [Occallatibacter riparius]UWZ83180.1 carboxypeptidase-like regulatory domain-containing protein [Occallatibacter riparius]
MRSPRCRLFLLLALLLSAFTTLRAQQNSEITGIVTDPSGNVINGAQVTLTEDNTNFTRTLTTDTAGLFTFPALNIGTYSLQVTAPGFQTYTAHGIVLNVSRTQRNDVQMKIGEAAETVTVQADALTVQTDSNVVSTLVNSEQITHIATENRNFAALAALGLGVSSALPDNNTPTSIASNFTISINGLRQSHNIWLIDGAEADDRGAGGGMSVMPSQDAISEFQTLTSNYPPDYGISSGATITLAFKSGTQKFHGGVWEFNRNTVFNANNWFNKHVAPGDTPTPRQKLNYNIFGGNIGGPLLPFQHPRRTFFFWNEEWRRLIQGSTPTLVNTLPAADFPTAGTDLHYVAPAFASSTKLVVPQVADPAFNAKLAADGLTPGGSFPNNTIPANLFDPNAVLYFNSGVVPHPSNSSDQVISQAETPINVRDDIVRIDHQVSTKWQLMGHYEHNAVMQGNAQPMLGWLGANYNTVTSTLANPSNSVAIKLSGTINPNLLVEASMNYDGNTINITNSSNSQLPSGWSVNGFFNNGSKSIPGVTGFGPPYYTAEDMGSAPWHNAAQDYMPRVDVSWTRGKHAFKFGFSYNRYTKNQQLFGDPEGAYTFSGLSNDGMMDFLMGLSATYAQFQSLPTRHYVNQTPSGYGNDNWHVTKNLSLQIGLRYDALPHAWERSNAVANFNPAAYDPGARPAWRPDGSMDPSGPGFAVVNNTPFYLNGMQLAGQNGTARGLVKNDFMTIQPRVGFSWDIFGNGGTVLRGGAGTFYERMQGNDIYNAATAPPFAYNPTASNVYVSDPHTSWVTGGTAAVPFFPANGLFNLSEYYPAPAVAQYSLGFQRQVAPSVIFVIQYVGNSAWNQNIERRINNFPLDTPLPIRADAGDPQNKSGTNLGGTTLSNPNLYRTFQGYGTINQQENSTNGSYNGFQTGLRAQGKHGLTGEIDYTWSHEIDITSYDLNQVSNPFDLKYDRGSGALDRRHILSANYVYALPIFPSGRGLAASLLGGWQIAGVVTAESGHIIANQGPGLSLPYDPVGLGGDYTNRPNVSAKPRSLKKPGEWFDTSVFSAPTPAWAGGPNNGFGNARKDIALGPGRFNFDTSLYKTFKLREFANIELRAESFNTFNHTEFNGIGSNFGNSTFGKATSTWDPRVLQFGGKFNF